MPESLSGTPWTEIHLRQEEQQLSLNVKSSPCLSQMVGPVLRVFSPAPSAVWPITWLACCPELQSHYLCYNPKLNSKILNTLTQCWIRFIILQSLSLTMANLKYNQYASINHRYLFLRAHISWMTYFLPAFSVFILIRRAVAWLRQTECPLQSLFLLLMWLLMSVWVMELHMIQQLYTTHGALGDSTFLIWQL